MLKNKILKTSSLSSVSLVVKWSEVEFRLCSHLCLQLLLLFVSPHSSQSYLSGTHRTEHGYNYCGYKSSKKNLYMYTRKHFSLLAQCVLFGSNMEVKIAKKLLSAPACVYGGSHSFFLSLFSSCLNKHLELKEIITV